LTTLTRQDGDRLALSYLAELEQKVGQSLELLQADTLEQAFGWVYFYNSSEYLKTGDFRRMLAGNAPFFVNKNSGEIFVTGTAKPIEEYIVDYEKYLIDS